MKPWSRTQQQVPLKVVGSAVFGRYPKISDENTFNMIISDNFLVPFAGYNKINTDSLGSAGRGIYSSNINNTMYFVVDDGLYKVESDLFITKVATLNTSTGDIFFAENNAGELAICDQTRIYIYNQTSGVLTTPELPTSFIPGYVSFQDTYFIATNLIPNTSKPWILSDSNNGNKWVDHADANFAVSHTGSFQTKPDTAVAAIRMPGRGNLLMVFGEAVTEAWNDVGLQQFPYQKNTSYNLDYGCLNPATIAALQNYVVWLAGNDQAGPTIMYSDGGSVQQISNDGINFKLARLTAPQNSYGFFFRQDGHLFYILTFYSDNYTLAYDFETKAFFTLTDENLNYFIAKKIVFFNDSYYFISINDGFLYNISTNYATYDGKTVPRIRICPPFRQPDASRFVVNNLTLTLQQGDSRETQRVDLSVSKDGGESFSNVYGLDLNDLGNRPNKLNFWKLGAANDFTAQLRFWGDTRFVVTDGLMSIYQ